MPARSVLENVFLGIEPRRLSVVDRGALRRRFAELGERTGFGLDPDVRVGALRTAEQQKVEILRAIARDARLIVMDEPTASLTADESERLLDIVRDLRDVGHRGRARLALPRRGARRLRAGDGDARRPRRAHRARGGTRRRSRSSPRWWAARSTRRSPTSSRRPPARRSLLEARGLTRGAAVRDVSLAVRAGEIVGLAGLVGSGRTEVARLDLRRRPPDAGELAHRRRAGAAAPAARRGAARDRDGAREPQGAGPADDALDPGERDARARSPRSRAPASCSAAASGATGRRADPAARRARAEPRRARRQPVRRQPAEGAVREVAVRRAAGADRRRADPRRRRRRPSARSTT